MRINWAFWLLLIFLVACSQGNTVPGESTAVLTPEVVITVSSEPTAVPAPEIVIIGPTDDYPEGCQPNEVVDLLLSFFVAYNVGDTAALDQTFAEHIEWYSDTKSENEQDHFVTYVRDGILLYLAVRQEQQDQLALLWLNVLPKTWHGGVDINYMLQRKANDLEPGADGRPRLVSGKGAIRCPERKIFVWSMGTLPAWEVQTTDTISCNGPAETFAAEKIVVCANGTEE